MFIIAEGNLWTFALFFFMQMELENLKYTKYEFFDLASRNFGPNLLTGVNCTSRMLTCTYVKVQNPR